jgi:Domain of unknown function (DUF1830)
MSQILDPIPTDRSDPICCCYINTSSKVQIARITNVDNWYFERVAFPGQHLVFEAPMNAYLEIHTGYMASAVMADRIPCIRLEIEHLPEPPLGAVLKATDEPEAPVRQQNNYEHNFSESTVLAK